MSVEDAKINDLLQRIEQLLNILKMVTTDLTEVSNALKTLRPKTATAGGPSDLNRVQSAFPQELKAMLRFEESEDYIIVKPRRFLGSENFAKIASIIRDVGGEYISAGRDSHFRVQKRSG